MRTEANRIRNRN